MSLNLQILMLLHCKYNPSSSIERQSGQFQLLIIVDREGYPIRVYISQPALSHGSSGQWYIRRITWGSKGGPLRYSWEPEQK